MGATLLIAQEHIDEEGDTEDYHNDGPELRGGHRTDESTAIVTTVELNDITEDTVSHEVEGHIVVEFKDEKKDGADTAHHKQENRLVEHCGKHRLGQVGEMHTVFVVHLSGATTRKEATHTTKGVGDKNEGRNNGEEVEEGDLEFLMENPVADEEGSHTANQTAEEGHTTDFKSGGRILKVVIEGLEERRRAKAEGNRGNTIIINKVNKFFVNAQKLRENEEHYKATKHTDGDHHAIHMHIPKKRIR